MRVWKGVGWIGQRWLPCPDERARATEQVSPAPIDLSDDEVPVECRKGPVGRPERVWRRMVARTVAYGAEVVAAGGQMDDATVADVRDVDGPVRCGNSVVGVVEVARACADLLRLPPYPLPRIRAAINSHDRFPLL